MEYIVTIIYDVNKRIRKPIQIRNINGNNLYRDLEFLAARLNRETNIYTDNNTLCNKLTEGIYNACLVNKQKCEVDITTIPNNKNCTSRNYRAIAEANFNSYKQHEADKSSPEVLTYYREKWLLYDTLTNEKENEEFNISKNSKWYNCAKDAKKQWSLIDWKGTINQENDDLSYQQIHNFFLNVFQSPKISSDPVLKRNLEIVDNYEVTLPTTDKEFSIIEVNNACDNIGTGTGLDGLPPAISKILPPEIKEIVINLFKNMMISMSNFTSQLQKLVTQGRLLN